MGVKRFTDRWKWPYFPNFFFSKMGVKVFFFSYAKEETAIALVFMMYDGRWTNNLSVVILFHN